MSVIKVSEMEAGKEEFERLIKAEEGHKGRKLTKREKKLLYYRHVLPMVEKEYGAYI